MFGLISSVAWAQNACRTAGPDNPCDLAQRYIADATVTLPQSVEEFGILFTINTVTAQDEKIVVDVSTDLTAAKVTAVLAANGKDISYLQTTIDDVVPNSLCATVDGPYFVRSGGQVVVFLVSADNKTLATTAVKSCPGES
jgi:hypothetical protein